MSGVNWPPLGRDRASGVSTCRYISTPRLRQLEIRVKSCEQTLAQFANTPIQHLLCRRPQGFRLQHLGVLLDKHLQNIHLQR